jgi:hypothetical protein
MTSKNLPIPSAETSSLSFDKHGGKDSLPNWGRHLGGALAGVLRMSACEIIQAYCWSWNSKATQN